MTRTLVLWRHGRTAWNVADRFQGHSDIPLDDVGRAQAEHAAIRLAAPKPDLLVCSDLGRARETVAPLERSVGLTARIDPRLREVHGGAWEGLTSTEIRAGWPLDQLAYRSGQDVAPGDTGEPASVVGARVAQALDEAAAELPDGGTAVAVGHGSSMRLGTCALIGLHRDSWHLLRGLSNTGWAVLIDSGHGWRLGAWNVTAERFDRGDVAPTVSGG